MLPTKMNSQKQFNHVCIKPGCGNAYKDSEVDAYYCSSCKKSKAVIAAEIDARLAKLPKERPQSDLQIMMEKGQARGNGIFVRARDLGITL